MSSALVELLAALLTLITTGAEPADLRVEWESFLTQYEHARYQDIPLVVSEPYPGDEYDRDEWRFWIDADGDCQNTRHEVLIEQDISGSIEFTNEKDCNVATGEWIDPWSGIEYGSASQLDIDHHVALHNAYMSGAYDWDADQRKQFANDMSNLNAVGKSLNRSKGSRSPEAWKPPEHWCQYAEQWVNTKHKYSLTVSGAEYDALQAMLTTCDEWPLPDGN